MIGAHARGTGQERNVVLAKFLIYEMAQTSAKTSHQSQVPTKKIARTDRRHTETHTGVFCTAYRINPELSNNDIVNCGDWFVPRIMMTGTAEKKMS